MVPGGQCCIIDLSLNQHLSLQPAHITKIILEKDIFLPFLWWNRSEQITGAGPSKEDLQSVDFVGKLLPQSNPLGRPDTMLFFKSPMLVGKGREREKGRERARDGGERVEVGGDEWEWWVYWVLSGWVDGGWMSSRAGPKIAPNREWHDAQPLGESFPIS